jgi:DNA-binding XRE family transcriptional regulator
MDKNVASFTTPAGEEMVVLPRAEYDRLLGLGAAVDEDTGTARVIARTDEAIARGEDVALPEDIWERLEAGENPLAVIRNWRGMTQTELTFRTDISQGYLSQAERGERQPTVGVLNQLAKALRVPVSILLYRPEQD